MNKLIIILAPMAQDSTLASSIQLHNQVSTLTFTTNLLHIAINNYQTISLTAGTYSNPILIQASDHNSFLSNIKVMFISSQLSFITNPTILFIGDANGKFIIGAQQNLIPTLYTFNLIKS
jgi:hypothetical protein